MKTAKRNKTLMDFAPALRAILSGTAVLAAVIIATAPANAAPIAIANANFEAALFDEDGAGGAPDWYWVPDWDEGGASYYGIGSGGFLYCDAGGWVDQNLGYNWTAGEVFTLGIKGNQGWRSGGSFKIQLRQADATVLWDSGTIPVTSTVSDFSWTIASSTFTSGTPGSQLNIRIECLANTVYLDDVTLSTSTDTTVALTSPVNGSDYLVGATIPATATELAGTAPYTVDFLLDSGSGFVSQGTDSDSPYTVNLTGLAIGSYSIKAAVTDSTPATAESAVKTFTVSNAGPTNLAAVSGNQLVNLSWNQVLGATGYTVFRSSPDNSSYSEIATGITDLTYQDTGLINGTPYYYVVKATVGATVSDSSNEVSSTPLAVDDVYSTVVASAPYVLADGVATSTITVTLKNGGNAPAPDLTVTLASSRPSDDTVSAASGLSDGNGVVTFTVKSSVGGTSEYTATVTDIPLTLTQKATVGFVDPVITPTGAIASSQLDEDYDAGNLIDDSALSGTAPHTIGDTHTGNAPNTGWLSSGATLPQTVTFDLGSSYLLTAMHIWQYGHPSANYSKDIKVQFSTTGTGGVFGGDVDITLANGASVVSAQTFAFPSITANAVKFTITSGTSGNYVGLSEVKFSAIPEPVSSGFATWAAANGATGQTPDQDHDNDGVENGIEYFMGQTGSSFTAMPGLDEFNTITWPASATYEGTYEVQTSPDLVTWTNVDPKPLPSDGNLSYLLPTGLGKQFVRLLVTPAP